MKVIAIANQKGGVGKTACAVELCTALGKKGYKVLGIDMDPQNSFTKLSGANPLHELTIRDLFKSETDIDPLGAIQHLANYDIISGNEKLTDDNYSDDASKWLLADLTEALGEFTDYDFIILDSAPGRSPLLEMEYRAADYIVAPTEADAEAESGLYKIKKDIDVKVKHHEKAPVFLGVFMNKFKKANIQTAYYENLNAISEQIGTKRFEQTIRDASSIREARTSKKSISDYDVKSKISNDFSALVDEIILRMGEIEGNEY